MAAKCVEIEIAKELVESGANREIKNNVGKLWNEMADKRWAQGKMFDDALFGISICLSNFFFSSNESFYRIRSKLKNEKSTK